MARKRTRKPRSLMGGDLYYQVSEREIEHAELLAGHLGGGVRWQQCVGHLLGIKRALVRLEAVDGVVPAPAADVEAWLAAAAGWPVDDAERFAKALRCSGHVKAMAGPSGGYVVAGMEPYQEMKKRHDALSEAGARGAESRKSKGGYGQAIATPKPGHDQDVAPESPDHGKQEQQHDQQQQQQHDHDSSFAASVDAGAPGGQAHHPLPAAPEPTPASMARRRKAKAEPTADDPSKPSPVTLLRKAYAATWAKAGRTEPLLLPVKRNGEIDHGKEGTTWNKILGAARQVAPPAATDTDVVAIVLDRLLCAASLQKRQQNTEGQWVGVPKVNKLEDFALHFAECVPASAPPASQVPKKASPTNPERMIAPREDGEIREIRPT